MTLKILVNSDGQQFDGDTMTISTEYLKHKATHLYIASQTWDKLYCEVDDSIPLGCLKHIRNKAGSVEVKLPQKQTKTTMLLLTELYPEKAGLLRKQFMTGRDLEEVL